MKSRFLALLALLATTPACAGVEQLIDPTLPGSPAIGAGAGAVPLPTNLSCSITQTVVSLAAGSSGLLIAANSARRAIEFDNVGANPVTIAPGTSAAVANAGLNLGAGTGSQPGGGSEKFYSGVVPTNAFTGISTAGTTVLVWECQ